MFLVRFLSMNMKHLLNDCDLSQLQQIIETIKTEILIESQLEKLQLLEPFGS